MKGFDAFRTFNAISLHFSSAQYDFFKYNGSTRCRVENYANNPLKWQFASLESKYSKHELLFKYFLVCKAHQFKYVPYPNLFRQINKQLHNVTIKQHFDMLEKEIVAIIETNTLSEQGELYPKLYEQYVNSEVSLAALIVIDRYIHKTLKLENSRDIIAWPNEVKFLTEKVTPFIRHFFENDSMLLSDTCAVASVLKLK